MCVNQFQSKNEFQFEAPRLCLSAATTPRHSDIIMSKTTEPGLLEYLAVHTSGLGFMWGLVSFLVVNLFTATTSAAHDDAALARIVDALPAAARAAASARA